MIDLSIIVPCYNESANLARLVNKCIELLNEHANVEIILVDNGSTDDSETKIKELIESSRLNNLRSYRVPINKGYGYGIIQGLKQSKAEILCWTHADLQTDIFDCIKAYELYRRNADANTFIKGKRKGRPLFDQVFTSGMQSYVYVKLGVNVNDINAQPKLFSRAFFEQIVENAPADFSLDLYFLINAKKRGKIIDFPVHFADRVAGEAKGGSGDLSLKIKLMKRTVSFINNFKMNNR